MRHRRKTEKLGRTVAHKKSMMSNLLVSLIKSGKIQTTEAKGKALKRYFDRVVSLTLKGDNASLQEVLSYLKDKEAFKILFREIAPRFREKKGGYCRLIKMGYRQGDAAPVVLVEIVE